MLILIFFTLYYYGRVESTRTQLYTLCNRVPHREPHGLPFNKPRRFLVREGFQRRLRRGANENRVRALFREGARLEIRFPHSRTPAFAHSLCSPARRPVSVAHRSPRFPLCVRRESLRGGIKLGLSHPNFLSAAGNARRPFSYRCLSSLLASSYSRWARDNQRRPRSRRSLSGSATLWTL